VVHSRIEDSSGGVLGLNLGASVSRVFVAACVLGSLLGYTNPSSAQGLGFRGWVSLIAESPLGWLENENRLGELCREARDLDTCYSSYLAPAVEAYSLRTAPDSASKVVGQLIVTVVPGRGLTSHYRPASESKAVVFTPDVFLQDWGYGPPYFHQTFLDERDGWYRLPADPWDTPVWLDGTVGEGFSELRLRAGDIVELGGQSLYVLQTTERSLLVRPEQDADMWCEAGDPPPLRPAESKLLQWDDLVDDRGHLLVRPKYMKGC
jgi:hypothetical protein